MNWLALLQLLLVFGVGGVLSSGIEVSFPSGLDLLTADESSLTTAEQTAVQDIKSTGSYLFKITKDAEKDLHLTSTIMVSTLLPSGEQYFRTHPTFLACVDKVVTYSSNQKNIDVTVQRGYISYSNTLTLAEDLYASAGTGVILEASSNIREVASVALQYCPALFAPLQRSVSAVLLSSTTLHLHMTGESDLNPTYEARAGAGVSSTVFQTESWQDVNTGLEPATEIDCNSYSTVTNGQTSHGSVTAESVVGASDSFIYHPADYKDQLTRYPGNKIHFPSGETRMSTRMMSVMQKLQKLITDSAPLSSDELQVNKLFDDADQSLYMEGRAADVQLRSSNTAANLQLLSKLMLCAGADFVENKGTSLAIAVKKQEGLTERFSEFPQDFVLRVSPPDSQMSGLQVPDQITGDYPIMDASTEADAQIGLFSTVSSFSSSTNRYLRLDPAIVECYDAIMDHEKKWNENTTIPIDIVHGFQSLDDIYDHYDPDSDVRGFSPLLGKSIQIKYGSSMNLGTLATKAAFTYDIDRLARVVVDECSAIFKKYNKAPGLGFYSEGLFVDVRDLFTVWMDDLDLPPQTTLAQWYMPLETRFRQALLGQVVNPIEPKTACDRVEMPKVPSIDYSYPDTLGHQRRKKRSTVSSTDCVPLSNTTFCSETASHRQLQMDRVKAILARKHTLKDRDELYAALQGCIGDCGTCTTGSIFASKTHHCSNFLHWAPFDLKNEGSNVTNFYHLENLDQADTACAGTQHCLRETPLFAVLMPTLEHLYRPDATKSVQEVLYAGTNNPLPVLELLYEMYAINAQGSIKVWVQNDLELKYLHRPLKTAMLYNLDVTDVTIYLVDSTTRDKAETVMDNLVQEWTATGCPLYTRDTIVPYTMTDPPHSITKRDVGEMEGLRFKRELAKNRRHFDKRWHAKVSI